jgi:hypothetical protein
VSSWVSRDVALTSTISRLASGLDTALPAWEHQSHNLANSEIGKYSGLAALGCESIQQSDMCCCLVILSMRQAGAINTRARGAGTGYAGRIPALTMAYAPIEQTCEFPARGQEEFCRDVTLPIDNATSAVYTGEHGRGAYGFWAVCRVGCWRSRLEGAGSPFQAKSEKYARMSRSHRAAIRLSVVLFALAACLMASGWRPGAALVPHAKACCSGSFYGSNTTYVNNATREHVAAGQRKLLRHRDRYRADELHGPGGRIQPPFH